MGVSLCAAEVERAVRDYYPYFQRGLISWQGEEALLRQTVHLRKLRGLCEKVPSNTHAHAQNQNLDCSPKILKLKNSIIGYLESKYRYEDLSKTYDTSSIGKLVPLKQLKEAISYIKGSDRRTVDKVLNRIGSQTHKRKATRFVLNLHHSRKNQRVKTKSNMRMNFKIQLIKWE